MIPSSALSQTRTISRSKCAASFGEWTASKVSSLVRAVEGDQRFVMGGYTEDKRVVLISYLRKDWELEDYYNMISDGFTVEGKGKPVFTIPKKLAPKLLLNTNTHPCGRSLRPSPRSPSHQSVLCSPQRLPGKTPADVHGGVDT